MTAQFSNLASALGEIVSGKPPAKLAGNLKGRSTGEETSAETVDSQTFWALIVQIAQEMNLTPELAADFLEKYAEDVASGNIPVSTPEDSDMENGPKTDPEALLAAIVQAVSPSVQTPASPEATVRAENGSPVPAGPLADAPSIQSALETSAPLEDGAADAPPPFRTLAFRNTPSETWRGWQEPGNVMAYHPENGISFSGGRKTDLASLSPEAALTDSGVKMVAPPSDPSLPIPPSVSKGAPELPSATDKGVIDQIVDRARLYHRADYSEIRIDLHPPSLGKLKMRIAMDNQLMTVKIVAETPIARDIIETNLVQLKTVLQNQGLEIDTVDVMMLAGDPQGQGFHRGGDAKFGRSQDSRDGGDGSAVGGPAGDDGDGTARSGGMSSRVDYFA